MSLAPMGINLQALKIGIRELKVNTILQLGQARPGQGHLGHLGHLDLVHLVQGYLE